MGTRAPNPGPMLRTALALLLALAVAVPAGAAERRQLTIGITQFPSTFHPAIDSMLAKTYVLSAVRRPFTAFDPEWQLICLLCVELPTLENGGAVKERTPEGKQGIAVTYTIQPGAAWGDGTPVTSADVVFSWKVGRHPKSGVAAQELYRRILSIDVEDERSFTLHFDRVTFDYNAINGLDLLPAHIERKIFEADPTTYRNRTAYDTGTTNPGLYFGPYRITEVQPGAHVVLDPNPTWWGEKPHFRRIVVRVIVNTAALEANLLSGAIDYIAGELGLTLDQALAFETRHGEKFNILYKPGLAYEHIDLNLANPALKDKRVRKALLFAVDREAISQRLFDGRQPSAKTSVNPLDWVYEDDVPTYPFDTATAARLLDEAGWMANGRGIRRNARREPLAFELMTTAGNRTRELVQQVLQSQWRQLGIDVRIRNEPARVYFGETVTKRKFTAMAMFAWISAPESVPRTTLHSEFTPTAQNNWSGQNYTGFKSPDMDELVDAIEVELDRAKRKVLWSRLQRLYAEELPALPLFFRANAFILPKWLKGVVPTGHQDPSTLWIERWHAG